MKDIKKSVCGHWSPSPDFIIAKVKLTLLHYKQAYTYN